MLYSLLGNNHKYKGTKNMSNIKNKSAQTGTYLLKLYMLLVVISAGYATYVVAAGTEGILPTILVTPLAIWTAYQLIQNFTK